MNQTKSAAGHKNQSNSEPSSLADGVRECKKIGCKSKIAGNWDTLNSVGAKAACAANCGSMKSICELSKEDIAQENRKKPKTAPCEKNEKMP